MKKRNILLIFIIFLVTINSTFSQSPVPDSTRFEWFGDAKLGIFIHWGIYGVNGIDESWSFFNGYISHEDYMKQLDGFTADKYDPVEWAILIKESGAKYAVITSKHHDGVALWDSKFSDLNVVKKTPAGRDLLKPFVKSLRKEKLKVGMYYSLLDWSHPDYPNFTKIEKRYEEDSVRWEKFMKFNISQINEVMDNNKPDLVWFDGDWEQRAEKSRAKERVYSFRDRNHRWDPRNQRPELWNLYNTRHAKGESFRVFPLSNWTELDVWRYIGAEQIPVVPLYFARTRPVIQRDGLLLAAGDLNEPAPGEEVRQMTVRFRTLGCQLCSGAVESTAATVEEIIAETTSASRSERHCRAVDQDREGSMEEKKKEGYF